MVDDGGAGKGQGAFALDDDDDAGRRHARWSAPPAWRRWWPGCAGRWRWPWPRRGPPASTTRSTGRWCGCWPAWRSPASRWTGRCSSGIAAELAAECASLEADHPGPRRRAVQRQFGAAAARGALRPARPPAHPEDQDRLLHRRPDPRAAEGPAPGGRRPPPLPGGGEAALDLRRVPGRRGGRGRPDPRHLPPDRGPHRPPVLRPAQPPQHPGPDRGGPAVPPGVRSLRGTAAAGGRLRPGRAPGHRPPLGRPGAHLGVRGRRGHPPDRGRPGVRGGTRRGHQRPALDGQDGLLRPGLRHGGLRAVPAAGGAGRGGPGDPPGLLRRLPGRARLHGAGGGRPPARRATRSPSSGGAVRCPTCSRPTTRSARRPSARP